ncbi:hemogen [Meriones unguiculatus]|uniref:hemogen n=1 Tax=Meriones unguiculatus TaxID=10047 RepID=UPI000B4EF706|nr:hemogen [Meriones unguiculatus]
MDEGKDQSHGTFYQTSEPHQGKSRAPEITGTWNLRNREHLRKRRAEAQEKQSQWLLGEQKKRKCQRTRKRNERGQKRQRNAEPKAKPSPQREKERVQEVPVPAEAEEEREHPEAPVSEALPLALSTKAVLAEHCSPVHQESFQCQEVSTWDHSQTFQCGAKPEGHSPTTCQNRAELQYSPRMCQDMAGPEAMLPKMCQQTAVPESHSSIVPQDMAGPEVILPKMCQQTAVSPNPKVPQDMSGPQVLSTVCQQTAVPGSHSSKEPQDIGGHEELTLKMCQEPTVLQERSLKMCQDVALPEVLFPKTHQGMAVPNTLPWTTPGDAAGPEECSPKALPQSGVPEGCPLDTCPKSVRPEKTASHPDQGMAATEDFLSETNECNVSEDFSTKTHQEAAEPEFTAHDTHKEPSAPTVSPKTTPGPEECSPETCEPHGLENYSAETYQEVSGPEDLSSKTCNNRDERVQKADGDQGQNPAAHEGSEDVRTFSQEMKEKAKADQDPGTPASPQGPQEICPENDIYSYALF